MVKNIVFINTGIGVNVLASTSLTNGEFFIGLSKQGLIFWLSDDIIEGTKIDTNITEEWFFQLCTLHDFGSLKYSDIEFVKDVFKNLCTGEKYVKSNL